MQPGHAVRVVTTEAVIDEDQGRSSPPSFKARCDTKDAGDRA